MRSKLALGGVICIALDLLWSLHFPIAKRLWTSSFVLLTGGISFSLLALFYAVIDVLNFRRWAFPLVVVGMNSLTIYLAWHFMDFAHTSKQLFSGLSQPLDPKWYPVMEGVGALALVWLCMYWLYRRKIFVRA